MLFALTKLPNCGVGGGGIKADVVEACIANCKLIPQIDVHRTGILVGGALLSR